jgi:hypothetical protein
MHKLELVRTWWLLADRRKTCGKCRAAPKRCRSSRRGRAPWLACVLLSVYSGSLPSSGPSISSSAAPLQTVYGRAHLYAVLRI